MVNLNAVNSYFHLFRRKSLLTNDFEFVSVSDLYFKVDIFQSVVEVTYSGRSILSVHFCFHFHAVFVKALCQMIDRRTSMLDTPHLPLGSPTEL